MCVEKLGDNPEPKELLKCINRSEHYLKARYKTHCNNDDSCICHCINHGLSHPKDEDLLSECNECHDRICEECLNIVETIASLQLKLAQLPSSHEREVAEWEVSSADQKIMQWQKHILRGVQQSKARSKSMKELGPTNAFWIRDYAQKVLPAKVIKQITFTLFVFSFTFYQTLEAMSEYFGKRGMTVSVVVFLTKAIMSYHKQVYLVALDKSDQGTVDTLCIADIVLEQFKKDSPHITSIDLKTDNAGTTFFICVSLYVYSLTTILILGNYHANGIAECMYVHTRKKTKHIRFVLQLQ